MKSEEDFLIQCGSLLKWMGFKEVSPREFTFTHQTTQRFTFNGVPREMPGETVKVLVRFSPGSFEIRENKEIPMENVDILINDSVNNFIMYYEDYEWFERLIKQIV